jgi:hypothetical protein
LGARTSRFHHCRPQFRALCFRNASYSRLHFGVVSAGQMLVSEALPLFHNQALSPMTEVALTQIDFYCQMKKLQVGGCIP